MPRNNLADFENKIKITFKDKKLLEQVFIHRSFLNENIGLGLDHNERLEFLGDAVLELVVTENLYKKYKNPEGELTNWRSALVRGQSLANVALELGIGEYLRLSRGEQKSGGKARELILANSFEALIGAIFLDQGYKKVTGFLIKVLLVKLPSIIENKLYIDPKSKLQELAQERHSITPGYKIMTEYGPDHNKSFTVGAYIGEQLIGEGSGSSKQKAEEAAASSALENWQD